MSGYYKRSDFKYFKSMKDPGNSLLQMINPDYKPLKVTTRLNAPSITSQPFTTDQVDCPKSLPQSFAPQSKLKPMAFKSPSANHRAGDWVCLYCNNHNYSFREVCNRCNVQTKVENLRQSLALYQNQNARPGLQSPSYMFDQPFSVEKMPPKLYSNGSPQTLDLEQSALKTSAMDAKFKEGGFQLSLPRGEMKESDRKEFAFEKQLYFSSSDDEGDDKEEKEDHGNLASNEPEKRILKFLNFD